MIKIILSDIDGQRDVASNERAVTAQQSSVMTALERDEKFLEVTP